MRVSFTPEATAQVAAIARYVRPRHPLASSKIKADIRAAVRTIAEHPASGRVQDVPGIRKSVTRLYGYLIYYAIVADGTAIDILTVLHPSRDRPYGDE